VKYVATEHQKGFPNKKRINKALDYKENSIVEE